MMRTLAPWQALDPARGSFLIRPRMIAQLSSGQRIFTAPTEPAGESFKTYSNAIEFMPVER